MRRIALATTALTFLLGAVAFSGAPKKFESFTLKDVNGKAHTLADYKDAKAIVVMFIATQCPVSNAYNERMAAVAKEYQEKGVVFLGVNSNKEESVEEVRKHAVDHGLSFTILKDPANVVADQFGASFTPEIYVLSTKLELLYHGRIDDSRNETRVTSRDLRTALDEVLAGKAVSTPDTKAFGCSIKRVSGT